MSPTEIIVEEPEPLGPVLVSLVPTPLQAAYSARAQLWITARFRDVDQELVDVPEVSGWVQPPNRGRDTEITWRHIDRGTYQLELTPDVGGIWQVAIVSSAAGARTELYVQG